MVMDMSKQPGRGELFYRVGNQRATSPSTRPRSSSGERPPPPPPQDWAPTTNSYSAKFTASYQPPSSTSTACSTAPSAEKRRNRVSPSQQEGDIYDQAMSRLRGQLADIDGKMSDLHRAFQERRQARREERRRRRLQESNEARPDFVPPTLQKRNVSPLQQPVEARDVVFNIVASPPPRRHPLLYTSPGAPIYNDPILRAEAEEEGSDPEEDLRMPSVPVSTPPPRTQQQQQLLEGSSAKKSKGLMSPVDERKHTILESDRRSQILPTSLLFSRNQRESLSPVSTTSLVSSSTEGGDAHIHQPDRLKRRPVISPSVQEPTNHHHQPRAPGNNEHKHSVIERSRAKEPRPTRDNDRNARVSRSRSGSSRPSSRGATPVTSRTRTPSAGQKTSSANKTPTNVIHKRQPQNGPQLNRKSSSPSTIYTEFYVDPNIATSANNININAPLYSEGTRTLPNPISAASSSCASPSLHVVPEQTEVQTSTYKANSDVQSTTSTPQRPPVVTTSFSSSPAHSMASYSTRSTSVADDDKKLISLLPAPRCALPKNMVEELYHKLKKEQERQMSLSPLSD